MKLLFKQRFFSWFDSYDIYDENGDTVYTVEGQLAWGHPGSMVMGPASPRPRITSCFLFTFASRTISTPTNSRVVPGRSRLRSSAGSVGSTRCTSSCSTPKSSSGMRATPIHRARFPFPSTTN